MARKPLAASSRAKPGLKPGTMKQSSQTTSDLPARLDSGRLSEGSRKLKTMATMLMVVGLVALSSFERALSILLVLSLLPSMVGWFMDNSRNQDLMRTVLPLNASSTLPFALQLWHSHDQAAKLSRFLANPYTWLTLYAAALLGYLLYYMGPIFIKMFVSRQIEQRRANLLERQIALSEEWGNEVKI